MREADARMALNFWQEAVPGGRSWDGETARGQANWDISIPQLSSGPSPNESHETSEGERSMSIGR
jgi:hypothetical protein